MTEAEIRAAIAGNTIAIVSESEPQVSGNLTTIDLEVVHTLNAAGDSKSDTQRILILDRGSPGESAHYGSRRIANYAEPAARTPNTIYFNQQFQARMVEYPGIKDAVIKSFTPEGNLPVRFLGAAGANVDNEGNTASEPKWYLAVRMPDDSLVMQPYDPS